MLIALLFAAFVSVVTNGNTPNWLWLSSQQYNYESASSYQYQQVNFIIGIVLLIIAGIAFPLQVSDAVKVTTWPFQALGANKVTTWPFQVSTRPGQSYHVNHRRPHLTLSHFCSIIITFNSVLEFQLPATFQSCFNSVLNTFSTEYNFPKLFHYYLGQELWTRWVALSQGWILLRPSTVETAFIQIINK